jgi:hypothetical protein
LLISYPLTSTVHNLVCNTTKTISSKDIASIPLYDKRDTWTCNGFKLCYSQMLVNVFKKMKINEKYPISKCKYYQRLFHVWSR